MNDQLPKSSTLHSPWALWPVAGVAVVTWISILLTIDPAGSYPQLPQGPGLTIDELFNVEQGVYLVEQTRALGWLNLIPGSSQEAYQVKYGYNPDHPPLGRWWLGVHHHLACWLVPPAEPELPFVTACARTGSASAFALTVLLIGGLATVWWGRMTGVMTAISLSLMPRVYGHAHLASLETMTNLTCAAAALTVAALWNGSRPPTWRSAIGAGILLGLAFLTKIQAIFIPLPVICWAVWRWRSKSIAPIVLWGLSAFIVFFAGWPYLWNDSLTHLAEYLGRTTNRATLQVWYFGQKYADKEVPWHYPLVMFALTVPATLHLLAIMGLFSGSRTGATSVDNVDADPNPRMQQFHRDVLLLACLVLPILVFMLPGIAVYDCERLFLTSFPLWAMFVGRGWVACWHWLLSSTKSKHVTTTVWSLVLAVQFWPLIAMSGCHLCYYNSIFQIWPGAVESAGLEIDYWGVGITRSLLQKTAGSVPEGSVVAIVPTLHPFQAAEYQRQSPVLRRHRITTAENRDVPIPPEFALVFRRRADLPPAFQLRPDADQVIAAEDRGGLRLAYLIRLRAR